MVLKVPSPENAGGAIKEWACARFGIKCEFSCGKRSDAYALVQCITFDVVTCKNGESVFLFREDLVIE